MDIYDRIKEIRKMLGLSQKAFGEKLGLSRSAINNIDSKSVPLKPLFLDLLCTVFSVNRDWLETGEGDMFIASSENIFRQLKKEYDLDELDEAIITSYLSLGTAERNVIKNYIKAIVNKIDNSSSRNELIANDIAATELAIEELVNKNAK